jgi:sugar lactone lactonase YvrE
VTFQEQKGKCVMKKRASLVGLVIVAVCAQASLCKADLLVSDHGSNRILRYDEEDGSLLGELLDASLDVPWGMTLGPDGDLYVANQGTREVLRYNLDTGDFIGVAASGADLSPFSVMFGPDENLYVVSGRAR